MQVIAMLANDAWKLYNMWGDNSNSSTLLASFTFSLISHKMRVLSAALSR
jgi:hypothetical protein